MKTLTDELKEYRLTNTQIARIKNTLQRGKTVRQTYTPEIISIFVNDDSLAEMEICDSATGRTHSIERRWV